MEKKTDKQVATNRSGGGSGDVDDYSLFQIYDDGVTDGFFCFTTDGAHGTAEETFVTELPVGADADKWKEAVKLKTRCVKSSGTTNKYLSNYASSAPVYDLSAIASGEASGADLEPYRSQITGTSYEEGSSLLGQTWSDQPYSAGSGLVQTFRDEFGMTNKARATVLKYEPNEFARVWRDHLIGHKWEIEQAGLFSSQGKRTFDSKEYWYTQGAVDFIANYGNVFNLDIGTKTQDDFLDDMSRYLDPR